MALDSSALAAATFPGLNYAPFPAVPAPHDFVNWIDSALLTNGVSVSSLNAESALGSPLAPPGLTPPLPDDAVHQDYASDEVLVNPSYNAASDNFDDTGMGKLSDGAQPNAPATGTADQQAQQDEATVAEDAPDPMAVAKLAVQSQLVGVNFRHVYMDRIDAMVADGLAFRYSQIPTYVYFASTVGDKIVTYILHREEDFYRVVQQEVVEANLSVTTLQETLAAFQTQQKADAMIGDGYLARQGYQQSQAVLGSINFVVHATPFLGTADYFAQGEYIEGAFSAAGDAAMLLSFGASKMATTAAQARNLRIGATVFEGGIGVGRTAQGVYSLQQGNGAEAAGYFGEAMLRFIGVSAATVRELRAVQLTKLAESLQAKLFSALDGVDISKLSNRQVGDIGEEIASKFLKQNGLRDIIAIKNGSNNGIDLVATTADGRLAFFEVKTTRVPKFKEQLPPRESDMKKFVTEVLTLASEGQGKYKNVSATTKTWAKATLRRYEADPATVSGELIGIDLFNKVLRVSPWR
jgi:hypothetical protein